MAVTVPLGPAVVNLTGVRAGDRNPIHFAVTVKGSPMDLTGLTLSAMARTKVTDESPAVTADIVIDPDPTTGEFDLSWPGPDVAASIPSGKTGWQGVWDLQADDGSPDGTGVTTLMGGSISVVLDVTR